MALEGVANTPVPVELFEDALNAIADLTDEARNDPTGRMLAVIRVADRWRASNRQEKTRIVVSLNFRLEALAALSKQSAYRAWAMKSGTVGMDYIHADLVEAAAIEPLILTDEEAHFDPTSFFERVLSISEARGRG
jgi:hypothetical protein